MSRNIRNQENFNLGAGSDIGLKTIDLFLLNNWKIYAHYNKVKKLKNLKNYKDLTLIKFIL